MLADGENSDDKGRKEKRCERGSRSAGQGGKKRDADPGNEQQRCGAVGRRAALRAGKGERERDRAGRENDERNRPRKRRADRRKRDEELRRPEGRIERRRQREIAAGAGTHRSRRQED